MKLYGKMFMAPDDAGGGGGGQGGQGGGDWRAALPGDIRASESLKKFTGVDGLAKSYIELEGLQGNSIRIPGPDAGADARKAFVDKLVGKVPELVLVPQDEAKLGEVEDHIYQRLGRPADEKLYKLPKDLPSDVQLDEGVLRATGKGLGLTQKQFEAFARAHAAELAEATKAERTASEVLKAKWGASYDERRTAALEVAGRLGVPKEALEGIPAAQLEIWFNVASAIGGEGGEGRRQADGGGGNGRMTKGEALARAAEIRNRKEYFDPNSPLQKGLIDEHLKLMKIAYPE